MKKLLLALPIALLVGCQGDVNVSEPATELRTTEALQLTQGLEGCRLFEHKVYEGSTHPIYIVRCNSANTISTNMQVKSGKTTRTQTVITTEGVNAPELSADLVIDNINYKLLKDDEVLIVNGKKYIKM